MLAMSVGSPHLEGRCFRACSRRFAVLQGCACRAVSCRVMKVWRACVCACGHRPSGTAFPTFSTCVLTSIPAIPARCAMTLLANAETVICCCTPVPLWSDRPALLSVSNG